MGWGYSREGILQGYTVREDLNLYKYVYFKTKWNKYLKNILKPSQSVRITLGF